MSDTSADKHPWDAKHLRLAVEAAGVAMWSWDVDTDAITMDDRGFDLWGVPWRAEATFEGLSAHIHPADRDRVRAAFAATRAVLGPYETDFRILVGEEVRWVATRGRGEDAGIVGRKMFGIFLDVTGRKQAEEGNELLAGEMSHRVKNLLTIASSLTALTCRSGVSAEEISQQLTGRLTALGRAHDLVRPLPGDQGKAALLGDLLSVLLAPYDNLGAFSGRVRVSVERMGVGEKAATSLSLVIHELATNSLKYGALSDPEGTLDISTTSDEAKVDLVWLEHGGSPVEAPETKLGFGSSLVKRALASQLGGTIDYDWREEGVIATLSLRRERLVA